MDTEKPNPLMAAVVDIVREVIRRDQNPLTTMSSDPAPIDLRVLLASDDGSLHRWFIGRTGDDLKRYEVVYDTVRKTFVCSTYALLTKDYHADRGVIENALKTWKENNNG